MPDLAFNDARRDRLARYMRMADPARSLDASSAAAAAIKARALARSLACADDDYRAAAWLARHWLHLGRLHDALDLATRLVAQSPVRDADARAEALRVIVLAGSEADQFERALGAAEELVQLACSRGDCGAMLSAASALAVPLERAGSSWQAARILSRALEEHAGHASPKDVLFASNALCAICAHIAHLLRETDADDEVASVLAEGRAAGERALASLALLSNPAYEVAVGINYAEILAGQGEHEQALALLRRLRTSADDQRLTTFSTEIDVDLGSVLLHLGRPEEALAIARDVVSGGVPVQPTTLARAHLVAHRACKALTDFQAALTHLEHAERIERKRLTRILRARSDLFVTRTEELQARRLATAARLEAQQERHRAAHFALQAEHDPLTGLGNRRHLERRAGELFPLLSQRAAPLALAQLDVDHFKRVNDECGHSAGDKVLVELGRMLGEGSRASDIVVRSGGEEFILVLPETNPGTALEVCERLRAKVEASPIDIGTGIPLRITISIGIAAAPPYELDVLARQADEALYAAKRAGRNRLSQARIA